MIPQGTIDGYNYVVPTFKMTSNLEKGNRFVIGIRRWVFDDGRMAGEGRCSCRCISRAGPAPASSPPPAPAPPPAHCQVQCQGHARASAAARRNAGAAGGGRRPASRQCLADDRETHRLSKFSHSRYNGSPDKHFRNTLDELDNVKVARNHRQIAGALGLIGFGFFR